MKTYAYRAKRLLLSGNLHKEYLVAASLALVAALVVFSLKSSINGGEFLWQALLGIFTGLFVGYMVDAVESWNRTRFLSQILSPIRVEEPLPVVVATLPNGADELYKKTGPGETIAIGLLYSAYYTLFSTAYKAVSSSNISVISSVDVDEVGVEDYGGQRIIFGGPRYNKLTRQLLNWSKLDIHYSIDDQGNFRTRLELKNGTEGWECKENTHKDFGLVLKRGRQLHVSGCRTWGVIGAASCLFSETSAARLVAKLSEDRIDPISDNYYAVISCLVPKFDDHYSIGEVSVIRVQKIVG